ncbi:hypothetical protein FRC09_020819 [Ceratobasidium sp. 395]|nr:hypothetical protein FRC09_020819 [Ceratobasidium sp. 395]
MSPLFPSRYYRAPDPSSLGFMLEYILPGTEPTAGARMAEGVEDLFVPLLQTTFKYFWSMAAGKTHHKNLSLKIEHVTPIILASAQMLYHLQSYSPERAREFATVAADLGAIEILAKGFVMVKQREGFDEGTRFQHLSTACNDFILLIAMINPAQFREDIFMDAFVEWFKALQYMRACDGMLNTRTRRTSWYTLAERTWDQVGEILGYQELAKDAEAFSSGCANARCPDPDSVKGVRFECPCNLDVVYCGLRCQKA